ncbi:hypothetical protein ACOACQ_04155 [Nocardioides sp. CPCC 206347]|uniref:hypothetical protein n=1 Tax=unclassified Nocardioides TaxID=2615069 RepID=UPI00361B02FF
MGSRRTAATCLVGALLLLVLGLTVWFDNPTVNVSASDFTGEPAGEVGCSIAPWDAGLNENSEGPGGEHPHDYFAEVGAECYSANMARFRGAVGLAALALLLTTVGVVLALRASRTAAPARGHASDPAGGRGSGRGGQ